MIAAADDGTGSGYWVRLAHGQVGHETAVARSRAPFQAAAEAGVGGVVHVPITRHFR
jgi:hypothetical protein